MERDCFEFHPRLTRVKPASYPPCIYVYLNKAGSSSEKEGEEDGNSMKSGNEDKDARKTSRVGRNRIAKSLIGRQYTIPLLSRASVDALLPTIAHSTRSETSEDIFHGGYNTNFHSRIEWRA